MRAPKKSETLEVRLPYAAKVAFMDRCRSDGRSASEAVRTLIDGYLEPRAEPGRARQWLRWAAAALVAAAVGAGAAPSLAHAGLSAEYRRLDADGSGAVSLNEFAAAASLRVAVAVGPLRQVHDEPGLHSALAAAEFARMDADRNGLVSFAEFQRYYH